MPEYFEISFIAKAIEPKQKEKLQNLFLNNIYLRKGENYLIESDYSLLRQRNVLFHTYQNDDTDYIESTISIPNVVFYKKSFENEFMIIEKLVKDCFKMYPFDYALCSYEMNSYFITNIKSLKDMKEAFLSQFPLYFIGNLNEPTMHVNLKAQDIFVDEH